MLSHCKNNIRSKIGLLLLCGGMLAFSSADEPSQAWLQQRLQQSFDPEAETVKLKKWELAVTPEGFFRLKKFFPNGKQEYFSFNLKKFQDMYYLGSTVSGVLVLKTAGADIIVQTYNDKKGNIDSMANVLRLPLKNVETTTLDSLSDTLLKLKKS